jgi:8-oxo-dGTP pyrophosphatase MutT (NUDIX family)
VKADVVKLRESLSGRARATLRIDNFRESAVLVPILSQPDQADSLLFTVRRDDLPTHAGQISFPGGKRDPEDVDAAATAIRETTEELGIEPAAIEVLGLLDDIPTPTGFVITPVVARIAGPVELRPNAGEVAQVFHCPLPWLQRDGACRENGQRTFLGVTYTMLEYQFEQHRIWGATARIVQQLLQSLSR